MKLPFGILSKIASHLWARNSSLMNNSDVFCMAPWIQLHAQTNGKIGPCCMASMNNGQELGDLHNNSDLSAAWNSTKMKQLRLNMLNGKKSSICYNCYEYEKHEKFSERMQYNLDFKKYFSRVKGTAKDGYVAEQTIPIIDIRFTNKCNYKCRICESSYSSLWYDEEQKLGKPAFSTAKEMKVAADDALFWESYEKLLPTVERLHFAGGEPLFMDEHYRTLQKLIDSGNTSVNLTYNTNFSTLRYKQHNVIELWKKFWKVDVWASLDGMGAQADYHRKGQNWKKIEENIRETQAQCPNVLFGVNVTVSIFNILHIPEFYRYMVENKFVEPGRMNLYLLMYPHYFSVVHLTPELKQKAMQQFDELDKNFLRGRTDSGHIRNHIKAVTNYMNSEQGNLQHEFRKWVKAVDELRKENFEETFPELAEMLQTASMI